MSHKVSLVVPTSNDTENRSKHPRTIKFDWPRFTPSKSVSDFPSNIAILPYKVISSNFILV